MGVHLYRHFAKDGTLLYVGISLSAIMRLSQHKQHSQWVDEISKVEIENFDSREKALKAEREAIRKEKPKHNVHHNRRKKSESVDIDRVPDTLPRASSRLVSRVVNLKPVYKLTEAAELLSFSTSTLRRLIEEGKIGAVEMGRSTRRHKDTGDEQEVVKLAITGWQIIEYTESLKQYAPRNVEQAGIERRG